MIARLVATLCGKINLFMKFTIPKVLLLKNNEMIKDWLAILSRPFTTQIIFPSRPGFVGCATSWYRAKAKYVSSLPKHWLPPAALAPCNGIIEGFHSDATFSRRKNVLVYGRKSYKTISISLFSFSKSIIKIETL